VRRSDLRKSFGVFISYARPDSGHAQDAFKRLHEAGLSPWLDQESIPAGSEWAPCIARAIRESRVVLVLLSKNSVTRTGFLQKEIHLALDRWKEMPPGEVYLIPARIEECPKHERLEYLNWVDLFQETGWPRLIQQLRELKARTQRS
jgi:hypothetical protein